MARRGKSQARRSSGGNGGLPGWAWMILGIVLTVGVVLAVPKLFQPDSEDRFYRPRPDPDAQPAPASGSAEDDSFPAPVEQDSDADPPAAQDEQAPESEYDFYTLLPGEEVPISDAELAASARAEAEQQQAQREEDAADLADAPDTPAPPSEAPREEKPDPAARYVLQAGAFSASGDAEALKARIALLGLSARVESAEIKGKTVYRVRMGPYDSASTLAEAKRKLGDGGLPALAIKVQ